MSRIGRIIRSVKKALSRRRANTEAGFTLIEVVVALTILSLSFAVLFGVFSENLHSARANNRQMQARTLVRSLLDQSRSKPEPATGVSPNGLSWQLRVTPFGQTQGSSHLVKVAVDVSWVELGRKRTVSLSTMRLIAGEPAP